MSRPVGGDPDTAERVRDLTRVGHSAEQIAAMLRVSSRTVVRYRRRVGVARPIPQRITGEQIAQAAQLLDDGASIAEAARTVGVSAMCIHRQFPDRAWSRDDVIAYAAFCSRIARSQW